MKLIFKLLILSLFTTLSFSAFAMMQNDRFKARILKVNEENVLILDRGVEDGVEQGDHSKITNINGFMARAICLRTGMITSHWKIYRVVYPEKISKDLRYDVVSINNSKVPDKYSDFQEEDFTDEFSDFSESELLAWSKKESETSVSTDLPANLLGDPALEPEPTFSDTNFDGEQFTEDFQNWTANIGFNPFLLSSVRDQEKQRQLSGFFKFFNEGKKYRFEFQTSRTESKNEGKTTEYDQNTGDESVVDVITRSKTDRGSLEFNIFNVIPRVGFKISYSLEKTHTDGKKASITNTMTPLGMQVVLIKGADEDSEPHWTFGLNPSYTKTTSYVNAPDFGDYEEKNTTILLDLESNINFSIGALNVGNVTTWGPNIDPKKWKSFNTSDVIIMNELSLAYPLSRKLHASYTHTYNYSYFEQYGFESNQKMQLAYAFNLVYDYEF
ncbi:MAG: hypothetical protein ACI9QD_000080 [Thermoproteota archaeon]|jgi:hypothetical protein